MPESTKLIAKTTMSKPDRRYWSGNVEWGKKLTGIYSIGVMSIPLFEWLTVPDINPASRKTANTIGGGAPAGSNQALYQFTTPPQSYEVVEQAATTIVPTQGGGKFIESHGNIFKEIRIGGTVGFRPNVPSQELFPGLSAAGGPSISKPTVFLPDFLTKDSRGLDPAEVTGFDEMMFLRNIFRFYYDTKATPLANSIAMVWLYAKESEAYVVEPIAFTTTRDRGNPLGWNYQIQLRSLYKLDVTFVYPKDSVNLFQAVSNTFTVLRQMAEGINRALVEMATLIDYFANLPANLLSSMISNYTTVLSGIAAVRDAGANFADTVSESVLRTIASNGREIQSLYDQINGVDTSNPTKLFDGNVGKARHSVVLLTKIAESLLTLDNLWKENKQVQVSDYSRAYLTETGAAPLTAGSQLNPANIKMSTSAKEVEITGKETIRTLALKYLGDEAQWKKLAIMNNLKPPYISENGGDGVLMPGETILIPKESSGTDDAIDVSRTINSDASSAAQRPMLRRYGRDFRLQETTGGELGDVAVSSSGDIDMVEGVDNVIQAVKIKFATEQGELPTHPTFGAKYPVGTKVTLVTIQEFAINARRTFFQDPRVEDILQMNIWAEGDQIFTSTRLKLVGSEVDVPFTFSVRR